MAKPAKSGPNKKALAIPWGPKSLLGIFDVKPSLHAYLSNLTGETKLIGLSEKFAAALQAGNSESDQLARDIVDVWCELAFALEDSFFRPKPKKIGESDRYRIFFAVHRELQEGRSGPAESKLNKFRTKHNMGLLGSQTRKTCLVVQDLPNKQLNQTTTTSRTKSSTFGISSTDTPLSTCADKTVPVPQSVDDSDAQQPDEELPNPIIPARKSISNCKAKGDTKRRNRNKGKKYGENADALLAPTSSLVGMTSLPPESVDSGSPSIKLSDIPEKPFKHAESCDNVPQVRTLKASETPETVPGSYGSIPNASTKATKVRRPKIKEASKKKGKAKLSVREMRNERQSVRIAVRKSEVIKPMHTSVIEDTTETIWTKPSNLPVQVRNELQMETQSDPPTDAPFNTSIPLESFDSEFQNLPNPPHKTPSLNLSQLEPPSLVLPHAPSVPVSSTSACGSVPPASHFMKDVLPLTLLGKNTTPSSVTDAYTPSTFSPTEFVSGVNPTTPVPTVVSSTERCDTKPHIPVWAVSRQELCELPYFKSMQGGVYSRGHTLYGYLLGRFPSPRDAWHEDGRMIISHGGGKNKMDETETKPNDSAPSPKPKHQLGDDQLESDKSVRALLTAYRMFRPVVILAEADYEHLRKYNLKQGDAAPANYYVLGHYAVAAAWAEKEEIGSQGKTSLYTRWKFLFQWIESDQGDPWWISHPKTSFHNPNPPSIVRDIKIGPRQKFDQKAPSRRLKVSEVTTNSFIGEAFKETCAKCRVTSFQVYLASWVCLNPDCERFWMLGDGGLLQQDSLAFDKRFLTLRTLPVQLQNVPYSIVPEYPSWNCRQNGESIYNRHFWAGACCQRCGRVSCRQKWQTWECPTCKLTVEASRPQFYPACKLNNPLSWETYGDGRFNTQDIRSVCRVINYPHKEARVVVYYQLPDNIGQIIHVLNNPAVTEIPDQLFEQYQKDALGENMFQRHAIKTHGVKGELYAQHFSFNAGEPYKYIAEAFSTPFNKCPVSVQKARDHIQYLCESALGSSVGFNELLSVAYAEGQEMNFHSDDEPGLGPVVAGLTLGSSAEMLFRRHVPLKKNMTYKNPPFRPSELRTTDAQNERVLQLTLSHGDLLIMDGSQIQRQYEHAVFVRDNDLLRFAATARNIKSSPSAPITANHRPTTYDTQAVSRSGLASSELHHSIPNNVFRRPTLQDTRQSPIASFS